jgi:hypothetical protein
MTDSELAELVAKKSQRALPSLPANFQQNVWRNVRVRTAEEATKPWASLLLDWCVRPSFVGAALTVAIIIGGTLGGVALPRRGSEVHASADFVHFSSHAPSMPATLLDAR